MKKEVSVATVIPQKEVDAMVLGLPTETARHLRESFTPIMNTLEEYEDEFNAIVGVTDIFTPKLAKKARDLRLKYVKVRTGTDAVHKEVKAEILLRQKATDGMRAIIRATVSGKEDQLAAIENFIENLRKEEIKLKQDEREESLSDYGLTHMLPTLGEMKDDEWERYFTDVRNSYQLKLKAEAEAALSKERQQKILRYASHIGNFDAIDLAKLSEKKFDEMYESAKGKFEKAADALAQLQKEKEEAELKAEATAKEAAEKERLANEVLKAEREKARLEAEAKQKEADQVLRLAREEAAEEAAKKEAIVKAERDLAAKVQAEKDAAMETERAIIANQRLEMETKQKAIQEAAELREKELFKGNDDKEKLLSLSRQFRNPELPTLTTIEGKRVEASIRKYLIALSDKIEVAVAESFKDVNQEIF